MGGRLSLTRSERVVPQSTQGHMVVTMTVLPVRANPARAVPPRRAHTGSPGSLRPVQAVHEWLSVSWRSEAPIAYWRSRDVTGHPAKLALESCAEVYGSRAVVGRLLVCVDIPALRDARVDMTVRKRVQMVCPYSQRHRLDPHGAAWRHNFQHTQLALIPIG